MVAGPERVLVEIAGRRLSVSNFDKPLYADGTTKGEVVAYYTAVAPALLPFVTGRPLTLRRWPDGTAAPGFFEKHLARSAPDWLRRATVGEVRHVVIDDVAGLVWVANLAGLELHVPQWRVDGEGRARPPDRLVVDLDPGPPADVLTCAEVALLVREVLVAEGLRPQPKTSGGKGLQLLAPLAGDVPADAVKEAARQAAVRLERAHPGLVVSRMEKAVRRGRVLFDWSQNHPAKTTIAAWSLRGGAQPTVSTPVSWAELEAALEAHDATRLRFDLRQAVSRAVGPNPWGADWSSLG
jgi:bifunctional non-homologous end joining protein LigD